MTSLAPRVSRGRMTSPAPWLPRERRAFRASRKPRHCGATNSIAIRRRVPANRIAENYEPIKRRLRTDCFSEAAFLSMPPRRRGAGWTPAGDATGIPLTGIPRRIFEGAGGAEAASRHPSSRPRIKQTRRGFRGGEEVSEIRGSPPRGAMRPPVGRRRNRHVFLPMSTFATRRRPRRDRWQRAGVIERIISSAEEITMLPERRAITPQRRQWNSP